MQGDREMQQGMKPQMDLQVVQVEFDHIPFSDILCHLVPRINKTYLEYWIYICFHFLRKDHYNRILGQQGKTTYLLDH